MSGFGPWIDQAFDYTVSRETVHISVDGQPICSTPIARFEAGMRQARRVLDDYYARKAPVVPIKRPKRGHAASALGHKSGRASDR